MVDGVTKFHLRPSGRSHLGILGSIIQPIDIEFDRIHFCSCFVRRIPVPGTGSIRKKRRTGNGFLSPLPHYHINTTSLQLLICVTKHTC